MLNQLGLACGACQTSWLPFRCSYKVGRCRLLGVNFVKCDLPDLVFWLKHAHTHTKNKLLLKVGSA